VSQEARKKLVRTPWVQSVLAWLVSTYLRVTLATMRWRFEGRALADGAMASPQGVVAFFWHGRIALSVACRRVVGRKPRRVMISNSPDGEFVAKVMQNLGIPSIRGSSTTDPRRNRRSLEAFREAVRFADAGGLVVITPDGPRGPAEVAAEGPVRLAWSTPLTPVFLFGLAARPALSLKSWDRTQIPLPFGRGCVVFDGPHFVPAERTPGGVEAVRSEWQARLDAAQARAEALVAAR
jgi:lysophospholipid acyltransferase (LPLAT)-like uncharacterized protein